MNSLLSQVINVNPPEQFNNLVDIDAGGLVTIAITFLLIIAALAFFFMLILGGIKWITSGGDRAKVESARGQITAGFVGLVIVFSAWAILGIIENAFGVNLRSFNLDLTNGSNPPRTIPVITLTPPPSNFVLPISTPTPARYIMPPITGVITPVSGLGP